MLKLVIHVRSVRLLRDNTEHAPLTRRHQRHMPPSIEPTVPDEMDWGHSIEPTVPDEMDWKQWFSKLMDEGDANERLKREDPAAYEAKMRAQLPTSKCCLCAETFKGYGHNAHPVRDDGVACDACNGAIVVPQRIRKWAP